MSWGSIFQAIGGFFRSWVSFATPQRADFESVNDGWKEFSHELREEIERVRAQAERDNRRTRREMQHLQQQLQECKAQCERERQHTALLRDEVERLSVKVESGSTG
jgi:hypothetical protein